MQLVGKTVIVTGGGSGIGRALCEAFQLARAKNIVVADVDLQAAERVAAKVGGVAFRCDVAKEADVRSLIGANIGLWTDRPLLLECRCSTRLCTACGQCRGGTKRTLAASWSINVMGHVYAVRNLIPRMKPRGSGYFLITASAAVFSPKSEAQSIQRQSTPRLALLKILHRP